MQIYLIVVAAGRSKDDSDQLPPGSPSEHKLRSQLSDPLHEIALTLQPTNPAHLPSESCLSLSLQLYGEARPGTDTQWGILSKPMRYV